MTTEQQLADAASYHPADPDSVREPFGALQEIRRTCPISKRSKAGLPEVTLLARYADARNVYRDYKTFGNIGFYPSTAVYESNPVENRSIIELDLPAHTEVRRLNLLAMKPSAVDLALPTVADTANELVGRIVAAGGGDVVRDLAVPLPADAIATVLGLPRSDAQIVHRWVATLFSEPVDVSDTPPVLPVLNVDEEFNDYIAGQIELRRKDPTIEDAIARMVSFRRESAGPFSDRELLIHIRTLLLAGNETTTSLLSNAVYRMVTVPLVQERLRQDRTLVDPFIEECLRMDPPLTQFPRRCLADTAVGDVELQENDVVSISIQSVNRDEAVWGSEGEQFKLDRFVGEAPDHLSFGLGVHFCIGAYLARSTTRIALNALLDATEEISLIPGYEFDRVWFFEFWRPKRLDVVTRAIAAV